MEISPGSQAAPLIDLAARARQTPLEVRGASGAGVNRDAVFISAAARRMSRMAALPNMRVDRVNAVREQIAAGTYETPEKIDAALDRLLDEWTR